MITDKTQELFTDKTALYISLGIVGGITLAVLSGQLDLIFKYAFWIVLGIGLIYLMMKMWKVTQKDIEESKKEKEEKSKSES